MTEPLERIQQFLRESQLADPTARAVPLTGDASDRRYFRILPAGRPPFVLALHTGPIDFASLPFANVAQLLQRFHMPMPAIPCHSVEAGLIAPHDRVAATL